MVYYYSNPHTAVWDLDSVYLKQISWMLLAARTGEENMKDNVN